MRLRLLCHRRTNFGKRRGGFRQRRLRGLDLSLCLRQVPVQLRLPNFVNPRLPRRLIQGLLRLRVRLLRAIHGLPRLVALLLHVPVTLDPLLLVRLRRRLRVGQYLALYRAASLLLLQCSAGTRQLFPHRCQDQLHRLALRPSFHKVPVHLRLSNLADASLPHDLALSLFGRRVGLRQVLLSLRQRLLQARLAFLILHHRRLGIPQLLLHRRQHALPHGSGPTYTAQFQLRFR